MWVKKNLTTIPNTKTMPFMWKEITWETDDGGVEVVVKKKVPLFVAL